MQSSQLRPHGSASAYCLPIVTIINKSSQMSHKTIKTLTTTWQPFLFKGNFIASFDSKCEILIQLWKGPLGNCEGPVRIVNGSVLRYHLKKEKKRWEYICTTIMHWAVKYKSYISKAWYKFQAS